MSALAAAKSASSFQNWAPLLEQSAREVFELMLGCNLTASATIPEIGNPDITSMVGLAGQPCGLLNIRCSRKAAALMAGKMLGMDLKEDDAEVYDAFGEVGNMVAGNFKNKIPGLDGGCLLSVPTVVTGSSYSLHSNAAVPAIQLKLLFENMPVLLSLQISE